jgi:signal transduction histidine kinase
MPKARSRISIGDARSLNWRTHLLFAVPAMLAAGFFDFDRLGGNPGLWLLLSIVGLGVTIGVIELVSGLIKKSQWKSPKTFVVLGILFVAGLSRGATLYFVGGILGIVPQSDIVYRLLGGPIFVISIYILIDTMVSSFLVHRTQARALQSQREQLEAAKTGFEKELARLMEAQRSRVRELVAPSVWELQKFLGAKTKSVQDAIFEIKALNERVVRPLSKEMSDPQSTQVAELMTSEFGTVSKRPSILPKTIAISESVNLGFFALVAVILGFNSQSAVLGITDALLLLAATIPMLVLAIWFFLRVLKGVQLKAGFAVILSALYGAVVGYLVGTLTSLLGLTASDQFPVQSALFVAVNMLFTLGLGVASNEREKSLQELEQAVEELSILNSRLRQQVWLSRKTLAMELHGSIQATLQSVAARLSKLANPTDKELAEAMQQVRGAFDRVDQEDYLSGKTLEQLLNELVLLWEGALDLQIILDPGAQSELEVDQAAARCVLEVCREAVTNAVKHGAAEQVRISIGKANGFIDIRAENDGINLTQELAGQGINLYREVAHTFSLEDSGEGVVLALKLPLSARVQP